MAARRIAASAVDWVAFAERVPAAQKEAFRAFKAKSDTFITRVHSKPETLPKLDWAFYKSRIANPALVDQFQKGYEAVNVPYPTDGTNWKSKIDAEEKAAAEQTKVYVAECKKVASEAQSLLNKIDSLPPVEEITHEMYHDYFPDQARSAEKPTFFPHTKIHQPGGDPLEVK